MSFPPNGRPRRQRRRVRPGVDAIESRVLLTAPAPFASFHGQIDAPTGKPIPIWVAQGDFGRPLGGRVILRFDAEASGGGNLDPGATNVESSSPRGVQYLARRNDVGNGKNSVTLAAVRPGSLAIRPTAEDGTKGGYSVGVSLAGDVNGDSRVNRSDLFAIRAAIGKTADASGVAPGTDVNGDGRVGVPDLLIALRNLGASTQIRPLDVTFGIDPAADPDGDGRVDSAQVDVVGKATPGARVRLDFGGDGTFDRTATADASGRYRFTVPLAAGANVFEVEATDRFGQKAESRITITRGAPAQSITASYNFAQGSQGWESGFADLPANPNSSYELDSGIRPLPSGVGTGTGYLLQGHNRSDDLFMFMKRKLGASDGVVANQSYTVKFTIKFASNAPSGAFGIGGAPGEAVVLKAGAGPVEPRAVPQGNGNVRLNLDKGDQSVGGKDLSVVGNIANGDDPVASGPQPYRSLTEEHTHTFSAKADANGNLWLVVGTDSGYEGLTALYYQQISVQLTPVAS
ncbi:dockerin type I domain-containing protein [Singulisphaera sp. PoT]|uniref:dockerin type I domain-containing protein n=1 Tax=Singulisphaera sp. PoT TaxID=3411797 RepID=UPI003BF550EE